MQYLIALYREEFYEDFSHIVNILKIDSCEYLLPKTANPALRKLLKSRQQNLQSLQASKRYGDFGQSRSLADSGIFGDKALLLRQAIVLLEKSSAINFHDAYNARRFELLLGTAEITFRAGLIEDCLAFLLDSYEDYREKTRLADIMEDIKIYKHFQRILRAAIPLYALLYYPWEAAARARDIYLRDFDRLSPDVASLGYLDLYASTALCQNHPTDKAAYELSAKSQRINKYRPAEPLLLTAAEASQGLNQDRLKELSDLYHQKISSLPHEAFVIMETIRSLNLLRLTPLNSETAKELLAGYLQLWKWIPSPLFINEGIVKQLGPMADDACRQEAHRIIEMMQVYSEDKLQDELAKRPELFRKKGEEIRRSLVKAKYMGV
ncbi:hypothetical protein [Syntrophomonas palmitatica]|uniref:hypothetical protein n=1 Tax=Syntrophomonas palmitatica TaxID=402877 RepID=UPI0006CFF784|nr:hypothetical protein [Syntrophomonas palmitatica]